MRWDARIAHSRRSKWIMQDPNIAERITPPFEGWKRAHSAEVEVLLRSGMIDTAEEANDHERQQNQADVFVCSLPHDII